MQTILVTGSSGQIGGATLDALRARGYDARPFDIAQGNDLLDEHDVHEAMKGCQLVVHSGAIPHDSRGTPGQIMATNVLGTWNVLLAAETHRVERVVVLSSAQVFGCLEGEGKPAYLPIDDAHPLRAARPYGMSKRLVETMCEAWTQRTGIPTVVLRPVHVFTEEKLIAARADAVEFGAFVHLDDVADAVVRSLTAATAPHVRMILCGPGAFDSAAAERTLGWRARRAWPKDQE
jgi:nucleoside-diphosphate-sugar epimerase